MCFNIIPLIKELLRRLQMYRISNMKPDKGIEPLPHTQIFECLYL